MLTDIIADLSPQNSILAARDMEIQKNASKNVTKNGTDCVKEITETTVPTIFGSVIVPGMKMHGMIIGIPIRIKMFKKSTEKLIYSEMLLILQKNYLHGSIQDRIINSLLHNAGI